MDKKIDIYSMLVLISAFSGLLGGIFGVIFIKTIDIFTNFRNAFFYVVFLMPLIGILIVYLNNFFKLPKDGIELVNKAIVKGEKIDTKVVPGMFITTTLSHLAGASVGRMEAPIKIGGAVGEFISKIFNLKKAEREVIIACSVSSLFGSVFGTPLTGAILACELCFFKLKKNPVYFLPVLLSSCLSRIICLSFGVSSFVDKLTYVHHAQYSLSQIIPIIFLILFSLIFALFFNKIQKETRIIFQKIKNDYLRMTIGSIIMVICVCLIGNTLFCGNDTILLEKTMESNQMWYIFIVKALLTSLCLAVGFKGGNIGPAFLCGASFGILFSTILNITPQVGAAIGGIALFSAVSGFVISPIVLGVEIFGIRVLPFLILSALFIQFLINKKIIDKKF